MLRLVKSLTTTTNIRGASRILTVLSNKNQKPIFSSANFHIQHTPLLSNGTSTSDIDRSLLKLDSEIRRVGRINRHEIEEILEDIQDMKKATSSQSLMIVRCCGELLPDETPENRTKLVQEIWKTMQNLNVPMDISHYNALLRVYIENEYKFDPSEFLKTLDSKGIEPNRVTFQRLITRYCQEGDINGASTILQHMKEKQLPINELVFNSLILGHAQANDMESAEGILQVMSQAGLEPNDDTYVTLMGGYAKMGDLENIQRIIKLCEEKEIHLMDKDFLDLIYILAKNNHINLIDSIIPYLKKYTGFNQEACNLILKLTNIGHEDISLKILSQMPRAARDNKSSGNFFIRHMVKSSIPTEKVIQICNKMVESGLNENALTLATHSALLSKNIDKSFDLLEALRNSGYPIRQHYFWPMILASKTEKDVYYGIKCMFYLDCEPNTETIRDYIFPILHSLTKSRENFYYTVEKLLGYTKLSMNFLVPAAMQYLFTLNEMEEALRFSTKYRLNFAGNSFLRKNLAEAYLRTRDAKSVARIIGTASIDGDDHLRETSLSVILDIIHLLQVNQYKNKAALLDPIFKELFEHGFGISNSGAEIIQNSLGDDLTDDMTQAILKLTSGSLVPQMDYFHDARKQTNPNAIKQEVPQEERLSLSEMEVLYENSKQEGNASRSLIRSLFIAYCRERNLEKAEKMWEEMKGNFQSTGTLIMLLDLYSFLNKIDKARAFYNDIKEKETPDFQMDVMKILRYANCLISNGYYDECLEILKNQNKNEDFKMKNFNQNSYVWKILNSQAEAGEVEKVKELFSVLKSRGYCTPNNIVLGPLIKAHLIKDDFDGAMEQFESIVNTYQATPMKQELFCKFIKNEDHQRLQKVMDSCTKLYGEMNTLYDLVFAFIECGKIRQAKKILETPGLRSRSDKLEYNCQKYLDENKIKELENLIELTRDMYDIDRNALYFYLLKAYCNAGDPDKALSVWTSLQEENVQISPDLLTYLADFLCKNNRPVPFVVPEKVVSSSSSAFPSSSTNVTSSSNKNEQSQPVKEKNLIHEFRAELERNDIESALVIKQRIESQGTKLNLEDASKLIEKMTQAERLGEAIRLTEDLFVRGYFPLPKVLRFVLNRISLSGDIDSLSLFDRYMTPMLKQKIGFDQRACITYVNAGRGREFFENNIKTKVDKLTSPDDHHDAMFTISSYSRLLVNNEDILPDFEEAASKAEKFGDSSLYNSIWLFHFLKKNYDKTREIWENKLKNKKRVLFRNVLINLRVNKDEEMAREFINQVMSSEQLDERNKAIAGSCFLEVLCENGKEDEALDTLKNYLKTTIKIEDFNFEALKTLKSKIEAKNEKFPFNIPVSMSRRITSNKAEESN